jgi:hypothetical protein
MPGIYLRECLIENVGPIAALDLSLGFGSTGSPKPVILVGRNGTGKTIFLAYLLDALAELAKQKFSDIVVGQRVGHMPFLKVSSTGDSRSLSGSSLVLIEFSDSSDRFCYIEKVGPVDPAAYTQKLRGRFQSLGSWPKDAPFHKQVNGHPERIKIFFENGSICFFPSSRHELPHWLNVGALADQPLFAHHARMEGTLEKPLVVERAAEDCQQWLMDVLLDSLVDAAVVSVEPNIAGEPLSLTWRARSNLQDKMWLQLGRHNVEQLLRAVLEDNNAQLVLNYRNAGHGRVAIRSGNGVIVPSLTHLSAGQAILFNLFSTVIRYADRSDLNKSVRIDEIEGIILVDEVDAHIHTDLQYEVLPRLIKLFPKVQFIVTSHAPLFLLGMEREFGSEGIQIVEMPTGRQIGTERFEEFRRSFECYRQTGTFEDEIERQVLQTSKPLVLMEGHTDASYVRTGLELLEHTALLDQLEIHSVGKPDADGAKGSGYTNLDAARKFLENNQGRFPRRVLFLYDSDTKKKSENVGALSIRSVPENPHNTKIVKGIENLFPVELFEKRFYQERTIPTDYGGQNVISEFRKRDFCEWICQERRCSDDFRLFDSLLVPILREFLLPAVAS